MKYTAPIQFLQNIILVINTVANLLILEIYVTLITHLKDIATPDTDDHRGKQRVNLIDRFHRKNQNRSGKTDGSSMRTEETTNNGIINYASNSSSVGIHTIGSLIFSNVPIDFLSRGLCRAEML